LHYADADLSCLKQKDFQWDTGATRKDEVVIVSQQKPPVSLQQRINELLHSNPVAFAIDEPKEESVDAISTLLARAEKELKAAHERVDRLKWELEKARS
jgi:hypothetical protein